MHLVLCMAGLAKAPDVLDLSGSRMRSETSCWPLCEHRFPSRASPEGQVLRGVRGIAAI